MSNMLLMLKTRYQTQPHAAAQSLSESEIHSSHRISTIIHYATYKYLDLIYNQPINLSRELRTQLRNYAYADIPGRNSTSRSRTSRSYARHKRTSI